MISVQHVHKWFGVLHVLDDVNLDVRRGAVVVIAGPSGSGKSTLIRTINRLETVASGAITVDGVVVNEPTVNVNRLRQDIGIVFQQFNRTQACLRRFAGGSQVGSRASWVLLSSSRRFLSSSGWSPATSRRSGS